MHSDGKNPRSRISTDIESAISENNQVVERVRNLLDSEELVTTQFEELRKAINDSIGKHHPDGSTLCAQCMKLHVLLSDF